MVRLLFVTAFILGVSAASAQQEHDACTRDASRFCRPYLNQGDQAVLACLQQNRSRLSRACAKVLADNGR